MCVIRYVDIMTKKVFTLRRISSVGNIVQVLKTTTHNLFPVVNSVSNVLIGTVSRRLLVDHLLRHSRGGNQLSLDVKKRLKGRVYADYDRKLISENKFYFYIG